MSESRFAGVDWASEEHAVCVGGERGRIVEGRGYRDNEEGIRALCARLARPRVVLVALERPDGLLIERLLDAGLVVIAVYPNLQVEGFLVERSECADALGRSAGVPVGRRVAGRGAESSRRIWRRWMGCWPIGSCCGRWWSAGAGSSSRPAARC